MSNIRNLWKSFSSLLPLKRVEKLLERPALYGMEEIRYLIPSIELGPDGPRVHAIFFTTDNYIGEVRVGDDDNHTEFDFAALVTVRNFRMEFGQAELETNAKEIADAKAQEKIPPRPKLTKFETIKVKLLHGSDMASTIQFVGNDPQMWISCVMKAIPVSLVVRSLNPVPVIPVSALEM